MSVDVVLIRARQDGPEATRAVAEQISARYGVPLDALLSRMTVGSFRVKSGTDLETANRYARDLESMGAICEVRDSATGRVLESPAAKAPEGLAAASGSFSADLGALAGGNLSLSTLDGRTGDTEPPPIGQPMAEPYNLATPPAGVVALDRPDSTDHEVVPLDHSAAPQVAPAQPNDDRMFAPPESDTPEEELVLAVDPRAAVEGMPVPEKPKTMAPEQFMNTPPADLPVAKEAKAKGPSFGERVAQIVASAKRGLANRTRGAFITGVAGCLVVGFIASHVVAVMQESGAYSSVRKDLLTSYSEARDLEAHAGLATLRDGAQDLINSRQRRIATTSMVVWLVFAGGMAFLWFRVIPWERLDPSVPPRA